MTAPLDQLYQEVILEHNRNPRNFKPVANASHHSHGVNPLCGDDYHLFLRLNDKEIVGEVGFQGSGCAISKSSASLMTVAIKGKAKEAILRLKDDFIALVTQEAAADSKANLQSLKIFEGVKKFPVRVKCATLIWRALESALTEDVSSPHEVSTE